MPMSKRDLNKRRRDSKAELAELEAKCKDGSGTKEDYELLAKMRRKMK
jgi:ribosomal protein L29